MLIILTINVTLMFKDLFLLLSEGCGFDYRKNGPNLRYRSISSSTSSLCLLHAWATHGYLLSFCFIAISKNYILINTDIVWSTYCLLNPKPCKELDPRFTSLYKLSASNNKRLHWFVMNPVMWVSDWQIRTDTIQPPGDDKLRTLPQNKLPDLGFAALKPFRDTTHGIYLTLGFLLTQVSVCCCCCCFKICVSLRSHVKHTTRPAAAASLNPTMSQPRPERLSPRVAAPELRSAAARVPGGTRGGRGRKMSLPARTFLQHFPPAAARVLPQRVELSSRRSSTAFPPPPPAPRWLAAPARHSGRNA